MFATVWPGTALTFDAVGIGDPAGHTVRYVVAVAPAGTPAGARSRVRPSPAWKVAPPRPARVSITRLGTMGVNPLEYQPVTSTSTWASPARLKRSTWPPVPSPTVTMLATVWPATKLRLDAVGIGAPAGHTVT